MQVVQAPPGGANLLGSILSVLGTSIVGSSAGKFGSSEVNNINNASSPDVTSFLSGRTYNSSLPKAYLNWILFDDQFNYVSSNSGVVQVLAGSSKQALVAPTQNIVKNGYIYVYVSNESPQNVYFDNLTVKQAFATGIKLLPPWFAHGRYKRQGIIEENDHIQR